MKRRKIKMLQNYGYQNQPIYGQQIPAQGGMQYDPNLYYLAIFVL